MKYRSSGILLHITSLPSRFGIGDFGPAACEFADFLSSTGQSHWQILPLNPPSLQSPQSPYDCVSAFAGNPLLISPELLCRGGLLTAKEIKAPPWGPQSHVNFKKVVPYKTKLLDSAFERFKKKQVDPDFEEFCTDNSHWLDNYAVFVALREHFRTGNWCDWPKEFRDIHKVNSRFPSPEMLNAIEKQKFIQYEFQRQWLLLKLYCSKLGIKIIGDIPIYVSYQSADVWANPQLFKLNQDKRPRVISGVPPDSFSKTGQLWGNPIYDWNMLKKTGYSWWLERIKHNMRLFDIVRLDHFRGFISYWQVPSHLKTAAKGRWVRTPGDDFFNTVFKTFHKHPFIIEDLGYITPAIKQCIRKYHLTGMRILMSGFDGSLTENVHYIKNHIKNCVAYTGTHDNNTIKAWFENETSPLQKKRIFKCIGRTVTPENIHFELIRLAMASAANLAVIPMQDVLGLGAKSRMNIPGSSAKTNWTWRLKSKHITPELINILKKITGNSDRIRI